MKRNDKQRLFEVMSRLDKTFKPKLNEDFGAEATEEPAMGGMEEIPAEEKEKSPEEKLQELTAKVDELYALLHGEESEEVPAEAGEESEESPENLQEWNFDKKKGDKKEEKPEGKKQFNFDKKEDKESKEHEESETPEEEEKEHKEKKELDEAKPKVPVAAIAKVGK
jgi:hypothetical protein